MSNKVIMSTTNDSVLKTKHAADELHTATANGTQINDPEDAAVATNTKAQVNAYTATQMTDLVISGEENKGKILHVLQLDAASLAANFPDMKPLLDTHVAFKINNIDYKMIPANSLSDSNGVVALMHISDGSIRASVGVEQTPIWQGSGNTSYLMCRQPQALSFNTNDITSLPNPSLWRWVRKQDNSDINTRSYGSIVIGSATKTDSPTAGRYILKITIGYTVSERINYPTTAVDYTDLFTIASSKQINEADTNLDYTTDKRIVTLTVQATEEDNFDNLVGVAYLAPGREFIATFEQTVTDPDDPANSTTVTEDQTISLHQMDYVSSATELVLSFPLGRKFLNLVDRPDKVTIKIIGQENLVGQVGYQNTARKHQPNCSKQAERIAIASLCDTMLPKSKQNQFRTRYIKALQNLA